MAAEAAIEISGIAETLSPPSPHYALGVSSSFSGRPWRFRAFDEHQARALSLTGMSGTLAQLLAARGVTPETAENFLAPTLKTLLPEPYRFAHMETAVRRFVAAVTAREKIAIFGDYDVDGACASALLVDFLCALGAEPRLYIPDRLTEGYGPSAVAMRLLRAEEASIIITVDCGAAAHEAFAVASDIGLDAIIIDHHTVEQNPPVLAHVNPNGPDDRSGFTYICSAGLVFTFLVAVRRYLRDSGWFVAAGVSEPDLMNALDIVALATIADVVPLIGVNRAFVLQGLRKLQALERPGLAALARLASIEPPITPYHLGFTFGPRINAGGRVGRCDLGARLLSSTDSTEAEALAAELDRHNRERQSIESMILESADAMAASQSEKPFLLVNGDGWHQGVVGIIAGRLKERYSKPVFVAGFENALPDSIARGSARSVAGVDIGALVRQARAEELLEAGGGHPMAAGFSVRRNRLAAFAEFLARRIETQRDAVVAARDLFVDALVSASGATLDLLDHVERAGPFGAGNPEPVFAMPDMLVAYADVVGSNHVRLRLLARDGGSVGAIAFRASDAALGQGLMKARGRRVHVMGKLKRDDYDGIEKVQLHLDDAALAGA